LAAHRHSPTNLYSTILRVRADREPTNEATR
jgi:hypothetical protein